MKPRKPFLLRLDPALHLEIERWAEQELRSVNGQIEWILRMAVRQRTNRDPLGNEPLSSASTMPTPVDEVSPPTQNAEMEESAPDSEGTA